MTLRDAMLKLADRAEVEILTLHQRYRGALITRDTFVVLAAAAIARANARAVSLGDLAVAAALLRVTGAAVAPAGITIENDQKRLRDAVTVILDADIASADTSEAVLESVDARLTRIARAEPLSMVQSALVTAMAAQQVEGWTRQTGPDPCPLCTAWADGVVRPTTVRMARHHGCSCIAVPA